MKLKEVMEKKSVVPGESVSGNNMTKLDMAADDNDSISQVKNSIFVNKNRIALAGILQIVVFLGFLLITYISKWSYYNFATQLTSTPITTVSSRSYSR